MLKELNDPSLIKALNFITRNSKIVGHDMFPINNTKELNYCLNKRNVPLLPLVDNKYNRDNSTFISNSSKCDIKNPHHTDFIVKNQRKTYKRTTYFIESMTAIGGGNLKKLKTCMNYIRVGGSLQDKVNYLSNYSSAQQHTKKIAEAGEFFLSPKELARKCFNYDEEKFKILSLNDVGATVKLNTTANPGFVLKEIFKIDNKGDAKYILWGAFEALYSNWTSNFDGLKIDTFWTMASRPKLTTYDKAKDKSRSGVGVGRVISLPDGIEQFVNHPVWYPLMEYVKRKNKECEFGDTPIMLGVSRTDVHWKALAHHFKRKWDYIYTGDWSQYDMRVPDYLLENAIQAMVIAYTHDEDVNHKNYINNWIMYVRENVLNGSYIIGKDHRIERVSGVPSGSLLTSLIDSITNYNALYEVMRSLGYNDNEFEIGVYGDDHYILFNDLKGASPRQFREDILKMAEVLFCFKGDIEETTLNRTEFMTCRYKRPVYKEDWHILMKGTSHLTPIRYEYSDKPFLAHNYQEGTTHRSSFEFKGKPKFLSYYWRHDLAPIRPLIECEARILNPESNIKDLDDYEALLWSWVFENMWNKYFLNDMYYLLMDLEYIKEDMRLWGEENVSVLRDCPYRNNFFRTPDKLIGHDRMWFRRRTDIEGRIDIEKEDKWIRNWSEIFRKRFKKLAKLYMRSYAKNENYDVRHQFFEFIRRDKSWKNLSKYEIGKLSVNPYDKLFKEDEVGEKEFDLESFDTHIERSFFPGNVENKFRNYEKMIGINYLMVLNQVTSTLKLNVILRKGKQYKKMYHLSNILSDVEIGSLSSINFKALKHQSIQLNIYLRKDINSTIRISRYIKVIVVDFIRGLSKFERLEREFEFKVKSPLFERFRNAQSTIFKHYNYIKPMEVV